MNKAILELTTKIPKEKLVYAICEFYWNAGHNQIKLIRETEDSIKSEDYDPTELIENTQNISEISVLISNDFKRELEFDFVTISIEDGNFGTNIIWDIDVKIKVIHVIFIVGIIIAFVATIIYGYHNIYPTNRVLSRYCTVLFAAIIFVPLFKLIYDSFERKIVKLKSHPSTEKYKRDFEEFIHDKEKELRSERH